VVGFRKHSDELSGSVAKELLSKARCYDSIQHNAV
jgi:hypothetical protein